MCGIVGIFSLGDAPIDADLAESRKLNIWELPLTVMEGSLQAPIYQNLTPVSAYKEIQGCFCFALA